MSGRLHPFEDPRRRCLRLEDWPAADRAAWQAAMAPGDILEGTIGPGHHWSSDTREKYQKGYGRWLTFLMTSGRFDPARFGSVPTPADRITPEAVRAYGEELREQLAPWTVWGRLAELLAVARAMAPEGDWAWLRRLVGRLEANLSPSKSKHQRLRPATAIFEAAVQALRDLERAPPRRHAAPRYRDALIVALLIACPTMRLRNLASITIGVHLLRLSDRYQLRFAAAEMKARKPVEVPVPQALTPYLDRYIGEVRPRLLASAPADAPPTGRLWICQYGWPLKAKMLHARICKTTEKILGAPINPHLFRDCAVTSVALDDPAHIGIAPPLLGHTDPRTTERHYIQAQQIAAGRQYRRSLSTLRRRHPLRHSRHASPKETA